MGSKRDEGCSLWIGGVLHGVSGAFRLKAQLEDLTRHALFTSQPSHVRAAETPSSKQILKALIVKSSRNHEQYPHVVFVMQVNYTYPKPLVLL